MNGLCLVGLFGWVGVLSIIKDRSLPAISSESSWNSPHLSIPFSQFSLFIDLKRGGVLYEPGSRLTVSDKWKVQIKSLQGSGEINTKVYL